MRKFVFTSLIAAIALSAGNPAHPHGGGLDSSGCHTDSKTGKRHCHRKNGATQGGTNAIAPTPVTLLSVGDGDTLRVIDKAGTKVTNRRTTSSHIPDKIKPQKSTKINPHTMKI